ncbi:MAG: hypothetical protein ACREBD_06275, partial [Blastocatellia bacterium]
MRSWRFYLVWMLTLTLCWQAAAPPIAAADSRKAGRDKSGKSSRSRESKRVNRSKPRAPQTNPVNVVTVSAASYETTAVAPDAIVAAFGTSLATSTQSANTVPLPTT